MKQIAMPKYSELSKVLSKTSLKMHPSEVHGLLCGMLCGGSKNTSHWEALITGEDKESIKTHEALQNLYDLSAKQLADFLFDFQLLLPNDSQKLAIRAEALTLWCQGFLTGLEQAHVQVVNRDASDTTEAINDLIEIAKMNYEEVVASEEDEEAYTELVEYVRMAIILIYQDLHEIQLDTPKNHSSPNLH